MKRNFTLLSCLLFCHWAFAQTFTLKSNALGGQATNPHVLNGFGCTGDNISPPLYWENAPKDTKSFAITMYDPDAPSGSGWWHWLIFDIDKSISELKAEAGNIKKELAPQHTIQSKTDFGSLGYSGPCPPEGQPAHRYIITVYALKTPTLGLDSNAGSAMVGFYLNQQAIEKASLLVYFKR